MQGLRPSWSRERRAASAGYRAVAGIDEAVEATRIAMVRTVESMALRPDFLIVDAAPLPQTGIPIEAPMVALARLGPCPEHRQTFQPVAFFGAGPNFESMAPGAFRAEGERSAPEADGRSRARANEDP